MELSPSATLRYLVQMFRFRDQKYFESLVPQLHLILRTPGGYVVRKTTRIGFAENHGVVPVWRQRACMFLASLLDRAPNSAYAEGFKQESKQRQTPQNGQCVNAGDVETATSQGWECCRTIATTSQALSSITATIRNRVPRWSSYQATPKPAAPA